MKNKFLFYFLIIIALFSCENRQEEITELNNLLDTNYEFNKRILNTYKGDYYQIISEQSYRKIENINELDSKFESLISDIDNAISNKESNLENIILKSNDLFNEIPKIVDNREDYLFPELKKTKDTSQKLRFLKNKLVIAMASAFEYASRKICGLSIRKVEIDNVFSRKTKNGTKLTLTSKYGQNIKENRHITINKIEFNGQEKKLDYKLKNNYSVVDIELDSLQKGTYRIKGIMTFYERGGKFDIPFNKEVEVE